MIASAMCLRATHKSTSSLLNTRARQGHRLLHTAKNVHLNKSFHLIFRLKILFFFKSGETSCQWVDKIQLIQSMISVFPLCLLEMCQYVQIKKQADHSTDENDTLLKGIYPWIFWQIFLVSK